MKVNKLKSFFKVALATSMAFTLFSTNVTKASAEEKAVEKTYMVPITELKSEAPIPAVQQAFAKGLGTEVQITESSDGTKTALLKPQHMIVEFGSMKLHCNILKIKNAKVISTEKNICSNFAGKETEVEALTAAEIVLPEPTEEGYPLVITVDFMNGMYGNIAKDNWMDVTLVLDEENKTEMLADYSKVDALLKTIPADLSKYTKESVDELNMAKAGIIRNLNVTEQARVNEMAAVLEAAIKGLEEVQIENTIQFEDNAIYEVEVALYNADKDQLSMAASSLKKTAKIFVKDGKAEMHIYTKPMTMGTITASLQEIKIFDLDGKSFKNGEVVAKSADGNPIEFKFMLPHTEEFIKTEVNPHVAIMGNAFIPARIKVNYSTLKKVGMIDDETNKPEIKPETKPEVKPEETNKPQENTTAESNTTDKVTETKVPQTGTSSNALMYFSMVMVSAAAIVMIYRRTRKA